MKFLFDLPNEELLPATCELAEAVEQLVKVSNIMELRTSAADGENKETVAKRNFKKIYFRLCKEDHVRAAPDLRQHIPEPLLKFSPVFCPRHQACHIQAV